MAANYDNSAWFYDRLSLLVYGKALINAHEFLIQFVPPQSNILIAGGGTGRILEQLSKIHPSGLKITYVEVSEKMLEKSRKRNLANNEVQFLNQAVEKLLLPDDFDVVITPFLFDNFTETTFQIVFTYLHNHIKPGGLWLNADFQLTGKWWQNLLLKTMFIFFKLLCNIEASTLPDIKRHYELYHYGLTKQQTFFGDFIIAAVYKKQDS